MAGFWRKKLLKDPPPDPVLQEIREVCRQLKLANERFSQEKEPDLIEACIYEQEALRARYRYLLHKARSRRPVSSAADTADTATTAETTQRKEKPA